MSYDGHINFGYSTVLTAPSPATTGTTLTLASGGGYSKKHRPKVVYLLPKEKARVQIEGIIMAFLHSQANNPANIRN